MVKAPEKYEEPKKPVIFLFLAALMIVAAILAYVYEDVLYIYRPYQDITFHTLNVYFFVILITALIGAFFFVYCYVNPYFGNRLLGRTKPQARLPKEKIGTVTYNVFDDTTPASVKAQHRRRKKARYARKKYAHATDEDDKKKK